MVYFKGLEDKLKTMDNSLQLSCKNVFRTFPFKCSTKNSYEVYARYDLLIIPR